MLTRSPLTTPTSVAKLKFTTATVNFSLATLVGVVSGDLVSINSAGYSATFADKTVVNGKPVTVLGVALSGVDAGNYTVSQPSGLTANITAKNLTINGAVANNKQYDGTTTATVTFSAAALVGVVSGDLVSINSGGYSATFADNTAANGKAVTVLGVTLSGADAGNYTVSQPSGLTANITPRPITVKATNISRVFGNSTPAFSIYVSIASLASVDTLASLGTPTFTTSPTNPAVNVGSDTITVNRRR